MKTSKAYYDEALKELGASPEFGVPIQAVTDLALIKAMKDFLDEMPFSFDSDGCRYVIKANHS